MLHRFMIETLEVEVATAVRTVFSCIIGEPSTRSTNDMVATLDARNTCLVEMMMI